MTKGKLETFSRADLEQVISRAVPHLKQTPARDPSGALRQTRTIRCLGTQYANIMKQGQLYVFRKTIKGVLKKLQHQDLDHLVRQAARLLKQTPESMLRLVGVGEEEKAEYHQQKGEEGVLPNAKGKQMPSEKREYVKQEAENCQFGSQPDLQDAVDQEVEIIDLTEGCDPEDEDEGKVLVVEPKLVGVNQQYRFPKSLRQLPMPVRKLVQTLIILQAIYNSHGEQPCEAGDVMDMVARRVRQSVVYQAFALMVFLAAGLKYAPARDLLERTYLALVGAPRPVESCTIFWWAWLAGLLRSRAHRSTGFGFITAAGGWPGRAGRLFGCAGLGSSGVWHGAVPCRHGGSALDKRAPSMGWCVSAIAAHVFRAN